MEINGRRGEHRSQQLASLLSNRGEKVNHPSVWKCCPLILRLVFLRLASIYPTTFCPHIFSQFKIFSLICVIICHLEIRFLPPSLPSSSLLVPYVLQCSDASKYTVPSSIIYNCKYKQRQFCLHCSFMF